MRLTASAPGKVMVSGEYGVLSGQPALVMAVNRRVRVRLASADSWRLYSDGAPEERPPRTGFLARTDRPGTPVALALWCSVRALDCRTGPLSVEIDSRAMQQQGSKLGLGSSAAVSVALTAALAHHAGLEEASIEVCSGAHDRLQGTAGSGFDVAAALRGGWFEFQRDTDGIHTADVAPPAAALRFVWTGQVARTAGFVSRYRTWEQSDPDSSKVVSAIGTATRSALAACRAQQADAFVAAIADSAARLEELAVAADLPIFAGGHAELVQMARAWGVSYKPCGAGGGDLGLATAEDESKLAAFMQAVCSEGYQSLKLECDVHGVRVERQEAGIEDS
ncbi:MAG: hypothetical protein EA417_06180 [Gammaproteobacteria bacterium]|nr:MAG: hypothetical protein EA417_06180 [Gammaproteobacteria bacterium]